MLNRFFRRRAVAVAAPVPTPAPEPAPPAEPPWLALVRTLADWTPPAGVEHAVNVHPTTGRVSVVFRTELVDALLQLPPEAVITPARVLYQRITLRASQVLHETAIRRWERHLSDLESERPGPPPAGYDIGLAEADLAFHRAVGVER